MSTKPHVPESCANAATCACKNKPRLRYWNVRVLASDGRPGLVPWTFSVATTDRDTARSLARIHIKRHGFVVKQITSTRLGANQSLKGITLGTVPS